MRLTVGPLPSAVYWRRRAVVLGAVVLLLIVLLYSCNRSENTGGTRGGAPSPSGVPAPDESVLTPQTGTPSEGPGGSAAPGGPGGEGDSSGSGDSGGQVGPDAGPGNPGGGPGNPGSGDSGGQGTSFGGSGVPAVPAAADLCTDEEILVTPVANPARATSGTVVNLHIKIKNRSERTCSRDVGADPQELFIKSGAEKVWSSDTCGVAKGSDMQSFTAGFERSYQVAWNGRDSSRCGEGAATGEPVKPGTYQLYGRLGTKLSEPVEITIVG
ncbi:hypothetical protein [Micromonospora fluostatini]